MAISIEIEKLEKRWQQTSGLVFAPLAEAYRKAGLQTRALEILEQGLALHAEYAPALIVRARCHLDTGDLGAAEEAFNQALGRDPNDPIALRGLADVFERTGRLPEAIERLRELVDVDPRNNRGSPGTRSPHGHAGADSRTGRSSAGSRAGSRVHRTRA